MSANDSFNISGAMEFMFTEDETPEAKTAGNDIRSMFDELEMHFQNMHIISTDEVEDFLFSTEMPKLKDICETILSTIQLKMNDSDISVTATMLQIKDLLEIFVKLLCILHDSVKYTCTKIVLLNVKSLVITVSEVLHLSFEHCKDSDNIYGSYFPDLSTELTALFKKTNELHNIYSELLKNYLIYDLSNESELKILQGVMEKLGKMCQIVPSLDIKTAAELWKSYIYLTQKNARYFKAKSNICDPIRFLSAEITRSLELAVKMDSDKDWKNMEKELKISSFNLKIIIKLCECYALDLGDCKEELFNLLLVLNRYPNPSIKFEDSDLKFLHAAQTQVLIGVEPLLNHLMGNEEFIKHYFLNILQSFNGDFKFGALYLTITIIKKLCGNENNHSKWLNVDRKFNILSVIFMGMRNFSLQLSLDIGIFVANILDEDLISLYNYAIYYLRVLEERLNDSQLSVFDTILWDSYGSNDWVSYVVAEFWSSTARGGNIKLSYNQIKLLAKMYRKRVHTSTTKQKFCAFFSKQYTLLSEENKQQFQSEFPVVSNVNVWAVLGLHKVNEPMYPELFKKFHEISCMNLEDKNVENFCDMIELISTLPAISTQWDNMNYLLETVYNIWSIDVSGNFEEIDWYSTFLTDLCKITCLVINLYDNECLHQLLLNVKRLLQTFPQLSMWFLSILRPLGTNPLENTPDRNGILTTIVDLFRAFLKHINPTVRLKAFEIFGDFAHQTPHEEILPLIIGDDEQLRQEIIQYLKTVQLIRDESGSTEDMDELD